MASGVNEKVLRLQISMDVAKLVKCVDRAEHLGDVEACMAVGKDTSVVQKSSEVATWNVLHGEIDALLVLERVQETDKPLTLRVGQDVSLGQNVSDLVELEQKLLAHNLESADLPGILLLCKVDLAITSLSDLSQDLEVSLAKTDTTLSQVCALSSSVLVPQWVVYIRRSSWWLRVLCSEMAQTVLTSTNIGQEVEVVIEEICTVSEWPWDEELGILLTKLGHISKALNVWLLQNLELLRSQASLCVVLADGWSGVLSCQLCWLVALLTLLSRKIVCCPKLESTTRDRWCILVGLLSQWAASRLVEDRIVVVT